jgi:hypothetical protein
MLAAGKNRARPKVAGRHQQRWRQNEIERANLTVAIAGVKQPAAAVSWLDQVIWDGNMRGTSDPSRVVFGGAVARPTPPGGKAKTPAVYSDRRLEPVLSQRQETASRLAARL